MSTDSCTSIPELISPYLRNLIEETGGANGPIGRQFMLQSQPVNLSAHTDEDPLEEQKNQVAPGMIYRYPGEYAQDGSIAYHGRVLWLISRFCASYCRFCMRGRMVGIPADQTGNSQDTLAKQPLLSYDDIEECIAFVRSHPEINEIILSGGDPLVCPEEYLKHIFSILQQLQQSGTVSFIRIHTRAPITNPRSIRPHHFAILTMVDMPHMVLHINHPAEITPEVEQYIQTVRNQTDTLLFSQSVLLKGVNDSVETLYQLFTRLAQLGVRPYYLHYPDPLPWANDYQIPFREALEIWKTLRSRISGIAGTAKFVVDTPHGNGKVPIPESQWNLETASYEDFSGQVFQMEPTDLPSSGHIYERSNGKKKPAKRRQRGKV